MPNDHDRIECSECGAVIDTGGGIPDARAHCPKCGGLRRTVYASVIEAAVLRDGVGVKAKRRSDRRPYLEDSAMPSYSHDKGKVLLREQIIDRDNDRYFEKVTDYETGEVIHHNEEPLSQHQGHGSAKIR
jgi:hypothetical protein